MYSQTFAAGAAARDRHHGFAGAIKQFVRQTAGAVTREIAVQRALSDLRALDDRMLRDIGISRMDLELAARFGLPERE